MSKKHFIKLADTIRRYNANTFPPGGNIVSPIQFGHTQILALADFCQAQNPHFNRSRWLGYIAGECGPSGGKVNRAA
jgi:hypothetical protein